MKACHDIFSLTADKGRVRYTYIGIYNIQIILKYYTYEQTSVQQLKMISYFRGQLLRFLNLKFNLSL